jgi:hypothetical protein
MMTCYINKEMAVHLANEVSEYLQRYAGIMPTDCSIELEEVGERVILALVSAVHGIAGDRVSAIQMQGHILFGAMHAGLLSALTASSGTQPARNETKPTVN